jgi:hypothetical protein
VKQRLDGETEHPGHAQRERQAWIIFVGLDRIDRLSRDSKPPGKLALAPPASGPMLLYAVFHLCTCKELFTGADDSVSRGFDTQHALTLAARLEAAWSIRVPKKLVKEWQAESR